MLDTSLQPHGGGQASCRTHSGGGGGDLPLWTRDLRVDDRPWRGVGRLSTNVGEEPAGDALLHHHHAQLGPVVNGKSQTR